MAKFNKGILGGFSGQVGNVVGSSWKGIDYMRSKPTSVKDAKTERQMAQRTKFALINLFLRKISPVIRAGFKTNTRRMTAFNSAMSYNLKNAITGTYPDLAIDYSAVVVARGDLTPAPDVEVDASAPLEIGIAWTDNSGRGSAQPDDRAMIALYAPELDRAEYVAAGNGAERQDEAYTLSLPTDFGGETVEAWLAFVSADGREASDSRYLGPVAVADES